jgi:hypothetical protein
MHLLLARIEFGLQIADMGIFHTEYLLAAVDRTYFPDFLKYLTQRHTKYNNLTTNMHHDARLLLRTQLT